MLNNFSQEIKKGFLFSLLCFFCYFIYAQHPMAHLPSYEDYAIVKRLRDSVAKIGVDTSLVFLFEPNDPQTHTETIGKERLVTYFIWLKKGAMGVIKINDTCLFSAKSGHDVLGSKIDILQQAIQVSEDNLRPGFGGPGVPLSYSQVVIVYIKQKEYLVVVGDCSCTLDKLREKYRKSLMNAISGSISALPGAWEYSQRYKR